MELLSEKTNAHSDCINSVAFSPDGTKIVSGSDDKTIKVWELRDQPVGERTFVASQGCCLHGHGCCPLGCCLHGCCLPTVIQEAYMNGCTPLSINGITVTSWEELGETFNEAEGEVTIKVWDSGAPRAQNRPSLAKTNACWLGWQTNWSC